MVLASMFSIAAPISRDGQKGIKQGISRFRRVAGFSRFVLSMIGGNLL
jgi:hypothetical protein